MFNESLTTYSHCLQIPRLQCRCEMKSMGDQFPAIPVIAGRSTYYVRPTIQGIATGGVKKFVGSRHAEMAMPIKKSYLV